MDGIEGRYEAKDEASSTVVVHAETRRWLTKDVSTTSLVVAVSKYVV